MCLKNPNVFNTDNWQNGVNPLPDKKTMCDYIRSHFRYYTASSINRSTSYANCVKLHKLHLSEENIEYDAAFDFLYAEHLEYDFAIQTLIDDFMRETGYAVGFNGRSGGYLVLYDTVIADNHRLAALPYRSIDDGVQDEDDEGSPDIYNWDDDFIATRFKLLKAFDTLCDNIRAEFISHICKSKIRNITFLKPESVNLTLSPDNDDDIDDGLSVIMEQDVPDYEIVVRYDKLCQSYIADVPELELTDITGESVEQTVMFAELAILEYCKEHPDAPAPKRRKTY